jgi:hypothetical protein
VGRRRKGAQVRRVERETPPCGTMAGYRRHLLNGEVACDACRAVNSATNREYYLRRRRQK